MFRIGRLAARLSEGYLAHMAALNVGRERGAKLLVPAEGVIQRAGGQGITYSNAYYLDYPASSADASSDFDRVWLVGALIAVSDELDKTTPIFLDHAPQLEMLRHLKNGVAHGNKFTFTVNGDARGHRRLAKYRAHNHLARVSTRQLEVLGSLEAQTVLFGFVQPTDVIELHKSIETYLHLAGASRALVLEPLNLRKDHEH